MLALVSQARGAAGAFPASTSRLGAGLPPGSAPSLAAGRRRLRECLAARISRSSSKSKASGSKTSHGRPVGAAGGGTGGVAARPAGAYSAMRPFPLSATQTWPAAVTARPCGKASPRPPAPGPDARPNSVAYWPAGPKTVTQPKSG